MTTPTTVYLITLTPYSPALPGNVTLRYATTGYTTLPTDTPANAYFDGRVQTPANYGRSIYERGQTFGTQSVGKCQVVLTNADGRLDALQNYGWAGWGITIETVASATSLYTTRQTYFVGTVEQALFEWRKVTLRVRDRLDLLDVSIQTNVYGGTTTGSAATADGDANLAGKIKPRLYGKVFNITPALANAFDLIYQVNDGAVNSIDAVRSNGAAVTATGADFATIALLRAAVIAAGSYSTCLALGYFRLGGDPGGQITADVTQGANAAARTAAQIVGAILSGPAGLTVGTDYTAANLTALDALNSAVCGIYIQNQQTILATVSQVLGSIGGWLLPNRLGVFQVGRLDVPSVTAAATYTATEIIDDGQGLAQLNTGDTGYGVPSWRVTINYAKNYTIQSAGQLAGSVNADLQSRYGAPALQSVAADVTVKTAYPMATDLGAPLGSTDPKAQPIDTCLTLKADADAEAARRLVMYKVARKRYVVPMKSYLAIARNLADTIAIQVPRFGLNNGANFSTLGIIENAQTNRTELDVWG